MPSHKVLQSVVRSVADSFTSPMNYGDGDYVMGHLLSAARRFGKRVLTVDLVSGEAGPPELLEVAVRGSVQNYCCKSFFDLVRRSGSDPNFVRSARLQLQFDTSIARPLRRNPQFVESPYECRVSLEDDRGKSYESVVHGWWYPEESPGRRSLISRLGRFLGKLIARSRLRKQPHSART